MAVISLEFSQLHDRYIATAPNDTSALGSLANELQQVKERVDSSTCLGLLTHSEAAACASIANNILMLSSCVIESNHAIEDLCADFMKKTQVFSSSLSPGAVLSEPLAIASGSSKPTSLGQNELKRWCRVHLSYLFPTNKQIVELSIISEMSESQVSSWFRNARTRSGWSKLYADKLHVNRDPSRMDIVFQDYNSYTLSHCQSDITKRLSHDKNFRLADKVWRWFQSDRKCKKPEGSGTIRPWVKTVLFEAIEKAKESSSSDFKSKEAHPFSSFEEPPQILNHSFFPIINPRLDIDETSSESSSSTSSQCSTLSFSSSVSSSIHPMSSSSTSHHVATPSSSPSEFLPLSSSSSFHPSSPCLVLSDLPTSESQDYPSPPDSTGPHQSSPPILSASRTPSPVEIINGLDALFQLGYSTSPQQFPSPHSEFLEASALSTDFALDSPSEFPLPSSGSTNFQETAEFESGQFDDASED